MNPGMRSFGSRLLLWGVVCGVFFSFLFLMPRGASAQDYDLSRMRQMNPDFSTYPDAQGIVWLKQVSYGAARDGGVERTHLWVVLGRSGLEERWLNWEIPEPQGGGTQILEAAAYAFDSGRKITDVLPLERTQGGVTMRSVRFEGLPETFILVLSWRDSLPSSLTLEDVVWTQETLPVWESIVDVRVPEGRPFFHRSFRDVRPEVKRGKGDALYTWRVVNTEPWAPDSLRVSPRGGVAFSLRQGAEGIARLMRDRAAASVPPAPSTALEGFRKGGEAGTAVLLSWLYGQPDAFLPSDCSRALPAEGPWTREEKLLLAHAWLRERGVNVRLHWKMAFEPDADSPVCEGVLAEPVLEVLPFRGSKFKDSFFYDMEDVLRMGRTAPLLMGSRIYWASEDGRIQSKKIPDSKAAANRLRALFDLRLNPGGALSGTVRLQARGAWRSLFFRGGEAVRFKPPLTVLFPNLRGYSELGVKESGGEAELTFSLGDISGILGMQGKNLLVILPAFVPEVLQSLAGAPVPLDAAFPFLIEQRVSLTLPPGVARVMLPSDTERGAKKVLYSDSYKASKLKKVTAEARLQVSATRLTEDDAASMRTAFELWRNFSARPLPVQMRGGE